MLRVIVGIDPGVGGAIAALCDDVVTTWDMPTVEIRGKRHVDPHGIRQRLGLLPPITMAVVEHVQGVQGTGATSAFSFGRSFGVIEGVLAGLEIPTTLVRPQTWTKAINVSRDKGDHRRVAMGLWPSCASLFARAKDDGRADAALLCEWWTRQAGMPDAKVLQNDTAETARCEKPYKIGTKRT